MFQEVSIISSGYLASPVSVLRFPVTTDIDTKTTGESLLEIPHDLPQLFGSITSSYSSSTDDTISLSSISDDDSQSSLLDEEGNKNNTGASLQEEKCVKGKRSIFVQYWKKTGHKPMELKPSSSVRSLPAETSSHLPTRRHTIHVLEEKKAQSTPSLVYHRPVSILRNSRRGKNRRSSSTSVTFDSNVDVIIFQPPSSLNITYWFTKGWSSFFAA